MTFDWFNSYNSNDSTVSMWATRVQSAYLWRLILESKNLLFSVLCRCFFFVFLQGWGLFRTPSTSWEHNQKMLKQSGDDCTQLSSTVSEDPGPQPAGPEALWGFALHQMEVTSCSSTVSAWLLLRVWRLKRSGALCGLNLLKNVFSWNFSQTWLLL